jgi:hypothetical protein
MTTLLKAGRPSKAVNKLEEKKSVRLNFDLSEDLHTKLKLFAVSNKISIADILRELVEQKVNSKN